MPKPVRKAVFPVAGLGTRFLPATKAMPKEMLPVVDRPVIQHVVDEARQAGIEHFIFVTGRNKSVIEDHFDRPFELEMTLLSPRNHFTCDVLAEQGSAHIESLCKWGPATFRHRRRKLPSGRPDEEAVTLVQPDPTWQLEYEHFTALCEGSEGNIANDLWINRELNRLTAEALWRPV